MLFTMFKAFLTMALCCSQVLTQGWGWGCDPCPLPLWAPLCPLPSWYPCWPHAFPPGPAAQLFLPLPAFSPPPPPAPPTLDSALLPLPWESILSPLHHPSLPPTDCTAAWNPVLLLCNPDHRCSYSYCCNACFRPPLVVNGCFPGASLPSMS